MRIVRFTSEYTEEWNEFITKAKNSTFLLHRDFMEYHSDRFVDHSLLILNHQNRIVALFPANEKADFINSHGGLTYGGLLYSSELKLMNIIVVFYHIIKYYYDNNYNKILYKTIPSFYYSSPAFSDQYIMFLINARLVRLDTSFTTKIIPERKFQKRRERMIKKAEKLNIQVEIDTDFENFWNDILIPNLEKRFGVSPVHTLAEIKSLKNLFPKNIIQCNVLVDNEIVGGTTIFLSNNGPHAQYISANEKGRKTGALDYLFSTLIRSTFSNELYFSFGISNEKSGRMLNSGLTEWKEGFGAEVYLNHFYEIDTKQYKILSQFL